MGDLERTWLEFEPMIRDWPERWKQHAINEKDACKTRLDPMTVLTESLHYLDGEGGL
jgi:hypothetical protein